MLQRTAPGIICEMKIPLTSPIRNRICTLALFLVGFPPTFANEPPKHVRHEIEAAQSLLKVPHDSVEVWPENFGQALGKTFRTAKPINTPAEYHAILKTSPWTYLRFGDVFEFGGWFFASLDSPGTKEPLWIHSAVVKKGTDEICFNSHW